MTFYNFFGIEPYFVSFIGMVLSGLCILLAASGDSQTKEKLYETCVSSVYKLFGIVLFYPSIALGVLKTVGIDFVQYVPDNALHAALTLCACNGLWQVYKTTIDGVLLLHRNCRVPYANFNSDDELLKSDVVKEETAPYKRFIVICSLYFIIVLIGAIWGFIDPVVY